MRTMGRGMEATGQIGPHGHETQGALYGHVEHLAQEEDQLLAIAEEERTEEHHARLKHIREELDRTFHHLRERHERRAKDA
jgi:hypothetical protein